MNSTACDLSLFFKHVKDKLQGLVATHIDDTLRTGTKQFETETRATAHKFDAKPLIYNNSAFAGIRINTNQEGSRKMHQKEYGEKIQPLDKNCSFTDFRSRRHELAWRTHTRVDVAAEAAILAQVTEQLFKHVHVTQLNKAINRIKDNSELGLFVNKLDLDSLHIIVYCDASFANLPDFKNSSDLSYSCQTKHAESIGYVTVATNANVL